MSEAARLLETGTQASRGEAPRTSIPATILVVEDEPEIRAPLCHALKRAGYIVHEAEDGMTACRIIGSQRPDLILLDVMLPDLDGWEVCRMLRQHPDRLIASTPVIMLTALNSPEDKLHGLELGADAYLAKPYSQQEVMLVSGRLVERHRREIQLQREFSRLNQAVEEQRNLHSLLFHELRNQLAAMQINADLLQHADSSAVTSRLAAIHRSSSYLQCLAEDFLLIRQVQGGQMQLPTEPILAEALAAEMLELYETAAQARGIALKLRVEGTPLPLTANRPAFRIIVSALLDNAVKYGPSDHPVEVVCRFGEWRFELDVCDAGEGVQVQDSAKVFDRFYRGDGARCVAGSGLGLFGVRTLANAMGGNAEVDDQYGKGNCFRVWIPFAA